jgi:hypothetical protein
MSYAAVVVQTAAIEGAMPKSRRLNYSSALWDSSSAAKWVYVSMCESGLVMVKVQRCKLHACWFSHGSGQCWCYNWLDEWLCRDGFQSPEARRIVFRDKGPLSWYREFDSSRACLAVEAGKLI